MPLCRKRSFSEVLETNKASNGLHEQVKVLEANTSLNGLHEKGKALDIASASAVMPSPMKRPREECQAVEKRPCVSGIASSQEVLDTVIINLQRRPDRLADCSRRISERCASKLRWKRLAAADGKREVIDANLVSTSWHTGRNTEFQKIRARRKGWNDEDESYVSRTLFMSAGERGCAMSHIRAWRICADRRDDQPLLVLEDDAEPVANFPELLANSLATVPADVDILYLGYSQAAPWRRQVAPNLMEAEYVWTTVAYLIWPRCAQALLRKLPVNQPVDNWMACLCADNELKAYCVTPKAILQAGEWNVNSDIRHSDEHYWGKDSNVLHSDNPAEADAPEALVELSDESSDSELEDL